MSVTKSPKFSVLCVGDALPSLEVALTPSHIVAGAIASRDFMPVHHDRGFANVQGAPDVFMNIHTTNGYSARYITDWAGPDARLTKISLRLGAPALPGYTLAFTGTISRLERRDTDGVVEVSFAAKTAIGDHATGTVELVLPLDD